MKNARFLVWINGGWVKITLCPNESLRHTVGGPTDEGFFQDSVSWTHDGAGVTAEHYSYQSDCDGRHEDTSEVYCPIEQLRSHPSEHGALTPDWHKLGSRQYDQYAELAGY